jgi:hypothetical protein
VKTTISRLLFWKCDNSTIIWSMRVERLTTLRFSSEQVAELLGVNLYVFRKRQAAGDRGPGRGRMYRWTWADVLRWEREFTLRPVDHNKNPNKNK